MPNPTPDPVDRLTDAQVRDALPTDGERRYCRPHNLEEPCPDCADDLGRLLDDPMSYPLPRRGQRVPPT